MTNGSPPSCRYSAPSRARARTTSPSYGTSTKKSSTSHARRRKAGSLERTTSMPSSRPMPRYISRQKSATVSAAALRNTSTTRGVHVGRELGQRPGVPVGGDPLDVERENLRWSLLTNAKLRCAGSPVVRWRRIVRVSRGSWSLSWQKKTTRRRSPPAAVAPSGSWRRGTAAGRSRTAAGRSDDRLRAHPARPSPARARGGRSACSARLNATHAAHPMRLYQR